MIGALLKKELVESTAFLFYGKGGKRRSKGTMLAFSALLLYGLGAVGFVFYMMADALCEPFTQQGLSWLYFAFMGTVATAMGVIGGMFTAKTKLYEAKDNDLLFSMPIPTKWILFSRMAGLYLFTLLFELLAFVPTVLCYCIVVGFSLPVLFGSILVFAVMPFGALGLCILLGWVLAFVSAKLPWKNLVTTLFSVAFLVAYFVLYSKLNEYLSYAIANSGAIASKMKTLLYPFFKLGQACLGDWLSWLLFALMFGGIFALVYVLVSYTYLKLVTTQRGGRKVKYKGKEKRGNSPMVALLKKELFRYTKNPMIALNSLLGSVFFLLLPFVGLFAGELRELASLNIQEELAMIVAVVLCTVGSMNGIAPSSVSLEGENLWIVQSLPIKTEKVLLAKAAFHALMTGVPAVIASVALCIFFQIPFGYSVAVLGAVLAFILLTDLLGLVFGLKMPNLHWTNELAAVKQGFSILLSMLSDWGIVIALVGGYFLFGESLFAGGYFLVCIGAMLLASGLLVWWLKKRGARILENL